MIAARFNREGHSSRSSTNQSNRRKRALLQQKTNRQKQILQNRQRAIENLLLGPEEKDVSMGAEHDENNRNKKSFSGSSKSKKYQKIEKQYAEELQMPEWMIDVPSDLNSQKSNAMQLDNELELSEEERGWFVIPRPEGTRCLVITRNGYTESRKKNGKILHHKFNSRLPNGSHFSRTKASEFCILDCIYQEERETYFVVDIISWKGQLLLECSAALRFFWLRSRLAEVTNIGHSDQGNKYSFSAVPVFNCDMDGLKNAYNSEFGYRKDGLVFFNKAGNYSKGLTPLMLVWKDKNTSRFAVDSPDGLNPYPVQSCVLKLEQISCEGINPFEYVVVALGGDLIEKVPSDFVAQHNLKPGDLLRFTLSKASLSCSSDVVDNNKGKIIQIEGLQFQNICGKNRQSPDSSCKIVFQSNQRHSPLTIERIAENI